MKNTEKQSANLHNLKQALGGAAKAVGDAALAAKDKAQDAVVAIADANGDGEITVDDLILWGLRVPGARVDRESYLRTELALKYPPDVIEDAVAHNPAHAGISVMEVDIIADDVIAMERNNISLHAAALGMLGGPRAAAAIPVELGDYYGAMLRAAQKLMYLYGFPSVFTEDGTKFDSATMNILTLCLGVMSGVGGANVALRAMARSLGEGVKHILLNTALTKGTFYPFVKHVANRFFRVKINKTIFSSFIGKVIPVAGSLVSGGITYASFRPCCDRLKDMLRDTYLSDPEHHIASAEEIRLSDAVVANAESHEVAEEYLETMEAEGEADEEIGIETEATAETD